MSGHVLALASVAGLAVAGFATRQRGNRNDSRAPAITAADYRAITTLLKRPTRKNADALSDTAAVFLDFATELGLDATWGDESEATLGPTALAVVRAAARRAVEQNIEMLRRTEPLIPRRAGQPADAGEAGRLSTLLREQGLESAALRREAWTVQENVGWHEGARPATRLHVSLVALRDMVTPNPQRGVEHDRGGGDRVLAGSWQDGVRALYGWNTGHDAAVFAARGARVTMIAPDGLPLVPLDFRDQVDAARMRDRVDAADAARRPRASAVVQGSRARPVPVDVSAVRAAARQFVQDFFDNARIDPESARGVDPLYTVLTPHFISWGPVLSTTPLVLGAGFTGTPIPVPTLVRLDMHKAPTLPKAHQKWFVSDAGYGSDKNGKNPRIEVRLYGDLTLARLDRNRQRLEDEVYSVLLHEVTHATELPGIRLHQVAKPSSWNNPPSVVEHHNRPYEGRAYLQQVADEVKAGMARGLSFAAALQASATWRNVSPHLESRGKKRMLKGVVTAVEDARSATAGSASRRGSRTTVDLDRRAAGEKPPTRLGDTARFTPRWTPVSTEWLARLRARDEALAGDPDARAIEALRAGLLAFGGDYVNVLGYDDAIPALLSRGQLWSGRGAAMEPGARSRCHANAARLWAADPASTLVATGYALSEDGLWREHSWGIRVDPGSPEVQVIETTTPRVAYFGFVLTDAEAKGFLGENA